MEGQVMICDGCKFFVDDYLDIVKKRCGKTGFPLVFRKKIEGYPLVMKVSTCKYRDGKKSNT